MSKKTWFQLMIIVFTLPAVPFMVLGWLVGYLWSVAEAGFLWGNRFIDDMIEKEKTIDSVKE